MSFSAVVALIFASVLGSSHAYLNIKDIGVCPEGLLLCMQFVAKPYSYSYSGSAWEGSSVTSTVACNAPDYVEPKVSCSSTSSKFRFESSSVERKGDFWYSSCKYKNTKWIGKISTTVTTTATCYYPPDSETEDSLCSGSECTATDCDSDADCAVPSDPTCSVSCPSSGKCSYACA